MKDEEKIVEEYGFEDVPVDTSDTPDFTDFIEHVNNIDNRPTGSEEKKVPRRAPKAAPPVEEEFIPFDPHREIVISDSTKPPKKRKHHG